MTQYLFMNEQIRKAKPSGPVIVCLMERAVGDCTIHEAREANEFELWVHGQKIGRVVYDPKMLQACDTHEVKAWVELADIVLVRRSTDAAVKAPTAREKRSNQPVQFE